MSLRDAFRQISEKMPELYTVEHRKKFEKGYAFEMDGYGNHRITSNVFGPGEWAMYQSISVSACGEYIGVTAYYEGTLPHETVLHISELKVL